MYSPQHLQPLTRSLSGFRPLVFVISCISAYIASATLSLAAPEGRITFIDNSSISGSPLEHQIESPLLWNSSSFAKPVPFLTEKISHLYLPRPTSPLTPPKAAPKAPQKKDLIELTINLTKDTLKGELLNFDDKSVTINTPYAGPLKIRRSMISKFQSLSSRKSLLSMPLSIDPPAPKADKPDTSNETKSPKATLNNHWIVTPPDSWIPSNRKLYSDRTGHLSATHTTPKLLHYLIDLEWRDQPQFSIFILGDSGFENYYELNFQSFYSVYFRRQGSATNIRQQFQRIDGEVLRNLRTKEKVRFEIFADLNKQDFSIYIDGQPVLTYHDPSPLHPAYTDNASRKKKPSEEDSDKDQEAADPAPQDYGLRLQNRKNIPLKISQLHLYHWDGKLPRSLNLNTNFPPGMEPPKELPTINLRNGDILHGELLKIEEKSARIKTATGTITIPLKMIKDLPLTEIHEPIRRSHDIRAWFRDGGHITLQLEKLTPTHLTGNSQTFGPKGQDQATFDLQHFHRLDFNIYNEDLQQKANSISW